jgi:S-DNA-T family DNA segregation ATPase FtsK/SpoIIIE
MTKSGAQLLSTIRQISDRFFGTSDQIDDEMWRARLADMMIEHLRFFGDDNPQTLTSWADALRSGELDIRLRGRSYTFVHDMAPPARVEVQELRTGETQMLIPRDEITNLLLRLTGAGNAQQSPEAQSPENFAATVRAAPGTTAIGTPDEPGAPANGAANGGDPDGDPASAGDTTESQGDDATGGATDTGADHMGDGDPADAGNATGGSTVTASGTLPEPIRALIANRPAKPSDADARAWLEDTVQRLRIALRDYGMDCKVLDRRLTPNAALIRLEGSNRLTPNQILRKEEELEVSHRLTLLNVLRAPGEVIVMIKREKRDFPTIREAWAQRALPESAPVSNTSFLVGLREDTGEPLYLNLATEFAGQCEHNPHTLIAGMTGGGKGVLVQNMLLDICATNAPSAARIWIIDPKQGLDYTWIQGMPHLASEMATTKEAAASALTALIEEMNRRFALFAKTQGGPQKIDEYNALVPEGQRIPRIYVFHDEFAFWGQDKEYRQLAEQQINGLGQMARAAGIHVILITQRPDRDVMPIQARENLGNRLALRVANENNASLIGVPGSDKLLPKGQLAANLPGEDKVIYAQVPFVPQEDLRTMADAIRTFWGNQQDDGLAY